jgi:hypothetical protein
MADNVVLDKIMTLGKNTPLFAGHLLSMNASRTGLQKQRGFLP